MKEAFQIDFEWLPRDHGTPVEQATFAELCINVNGEIATELEEIESRSVRRSVRACAHHLAYWLASNWWRIRWEPSGPAERDIDWQLSHRLPAAGGGFVWPDLEIISDWPFVFIRSRPGGASRTEPVRYLNEIEKYMPADAFTRGADKFIDAVVTRIRDIDETDDLVELWELLRKERSDHEFKVLRQHEAILGFDPGEAPETLLEAWRDAVERLGEQATRELAAAGRARFKEYLDALYGHVSENTTPIEIPDVANVRKCLGNGMSSRGLPWKQGVGAAAVVRNSWGLATAPLDNDTLSRMYGVDPALLEPRKQTGYPPFSAGFRNGGTNGKLSVFLDKSWTTGRRFSLARLIGDYFNSNENDAVLPATNARTARQKFQRAFAQELLCPFDALMEWLGGEGGTDDESIEAAAQHFEVSPLLVKTTLVNRGVVDRDRVAEFQS